MKSFPFNKLLLAVPLMASLLASSAPAYAGPDSAAFEKQMEEYLAKDSNVEKIGNALEGYFRKQRQNQEQQAAKAEADRLENQFKNPVKFELENASFKGKKDAKITIVEFSDFQCPYCQRGAKVVEEVLKAYPNDVRVAFKHYPLPFHGDAKPAAIASLAAGKQGKFWEMHDKLFAKQDQLKKEKFVEYAKELGLDVGKFTADLESTDLAKEVDADMQLGMKNGVQGTPAFFINGVMLSGAQPLDRFKAVIDRWLSGNAPVKK